MGSRWRASYPEGQYDQKAVELPGAATVIYPSSRLLVGSHMKEVSLRLMKPDIETALLACCTAWCWFGSLATTVGLSDDRSLEVRVCGTGHFVVRLAAFPLRETRRSWIGAALDTSAQPGYITL